jgi:hypothetical protein
MTKTLALVAAVAAVAAGCGGEATSGSPGGSDAAQASGASASAKAQNKRVLPVPRNPISNQATAPGLTITKALVENNVSPTTGRDVPDHLEVALKNTSAKPLDDLEIYYRISDRTKGLAEGYHVKLNGFVIRPGATRVAHFDNTGGKDHFPVNRYSLYYVDKNELVVDVMASSNGVEPATFRVKKDAASAEEGVE